MFKGATPVDAWTPQGATLVDSPSPTPSAPTGGATGSWAPERSLGDEASRQAGLLVRALSSAVASPVTVAGNALNKFINGASELVGHPANLQMPGTMLQKGLTQAGLPVPETTIENLTQGLGETAVGAALPASLLATLGGNAALSGATSEPGSEGSSIAWGGGGALAGRALNRTLSGLVKPTKAAQDLMDQGVRLTPGQAGTPIMGTLARTYEDALTTVPIIGKRMENVQQQGLQDWNRVLFKDASPLAEDVIGSAKINPTAPIGHEGLKEAVAMSKARYGDLYSGVHVQVPPSEASAAVADVLKAHERNLSPSAYDDLQREATRVRASLIEGVPGADFNEQVLGDLKNLAQSAYSSGQYRMGKAYDALKDAAAKKLAEASDTLTQRTGEFAVNKSVADTAYRSIKDLENAVSQPATLKRPDQEFYPSQLIQALRARDPSKGKALTARGNDAMDAAQAAHQIFGTQPTVMGKLGNMVKTAAVGAGAHAVFSPVVTIPAALASLLGTTDMGRKVLLGQYSLQQWMQRYPNQAAQVGRILAEQAGEQR